MDDIRRNVFTEVARLAYEGGDYSRIDLIPYKIVPGEVAKHRHDVFLERAIVQERLRLAVGLPLQPVDVRAPASAGIEAAAAADDKFFEEPLVNIITFACNACPPKQVWVTNACQGCISHPCQAVCPKGAIHVDKDHHSVIDQDKCIKCGKCFNQCPYHAITKIERPCAAACGMDAIESDEHGHAKINYDKCVSCGMCLVNCPFAAIADKSQIFQLINAMKRGAEVIACVAPAVAEVIHRIQPDRQMQMDYGDGLRECRKMLLMAKAGKRDGYLLEGMACPGGCVAGAGTIRPVREEALNVQKYKDQASRKSALDSGFREELPEVEE